MLGLASRIRLYRYQAPASNIFDAAHRARYILALRLKEGRRSRWV